MRTLSIPGSVLPVLLVALIAGAWTGAASAATVTVTDDTAADFSAGTTSGTVVRAPGSVELARTLETTFPGPGLPPGFSSTPWTAGGTSTVTGGAVVVDGARLDSGVSGGPGSSLTFTATFGTQAFQHVGFGIDFDTQPFWAMFSTGPDAADLYARTFDGTTATDTPLGVSLGVSHAFRIDWTATGFDFFVDGTLRTSHTITLPTMTVEASDFLLAAPSLSVDDMTLNTHVASGTFTSRVLDAGDDRVTGVTLNPTATTPAGTAVTYEARSAATAADLSAQAFTPLGPGGAVTGGARFVQYRATLSTTAPPQTPSLDRVDAVFTIDDQGPTVTIGAPQVSGTSAQIPFSADDATATFECALDGAAFASCASPVSYDNLAAGSHVLRVRATDTFGNTGAVAEQAFTIATPAPPSGGSTPPPPSGGGTVTPKPDRTAPKVVLSPRTVRASRSWRVTFRLTCPRSEKRCRVTLKLTRGHTTLARRTVTIRGGRTAHVTLRLRHSARGLLRRHPRLRATATTVARDPAGNSRTRRVAITILAPVRNRTPPGFTG